MMMMFVLWVLGLVPAHAAGPTPITGGNLGNDVWIAADSPYIVSGDATVQAGATLVIQAGVEVRFASSDGNNTGLDTGAVELTIVGNLDAQGTAGSPVTFMSDSSTSAGSWYGLVIDSSATGVTLANTVIRHAQYGIHTAGPTVSLTDVTIERTSGAGLYVNGGAPAADGLTVTDGYRGVYLSGSGGGTYNNCLINNHSSYGIYATNNTDIGTALFDHCTITDNSYAIYTNNSSASDYTIKNSNLTGNTSYGAYENGSNVVRLQYTNHWDNGSGDRNVTITNSFSANPLYVSGSDFALTENSPSRYASDTNTDLGPDWLAYGGTPTPGLYGTLWTDLTLPSGSHTLAGDLTVPAGVTLTVDAGATLEWAANSDIMQSGNDLTKGELIVQGALVVAGTSGNEVAFTSSGSATDSWYGVDFQAGASGGSVTHATIDEAIYGIRYRATANNPVDHLTVSRTSAASLLVQGGANTFDHLTLTDAYRGVHLDQSGGGTFSNCHIYNHSSYGIYATNNTDIGTALFDHCTITDNSYAIYTNNSSASDYTIKNSNLTGNTSYGAYENGSNVVRLQYTNHWDNGSGDRNVTITNSFSANPLYVSGSDFALTENSPSRYASDTNTDLGPDWLAWSGATTPGLYGTLWTDLTLNAGTHTLAGDLTVPAGTILTVEPGATLEWVANSDIMQSGSDLTKGELIVQGTLVVAGTSGNEAVFTSTGSGSEAWYGIDVQPGATGGSVTHAIVNEALYGMRYRATATNPVDHLTVSNTTNAALAVQGGANTFDHLIFTNGYRGILLEQSGGGTFSNCLIHDNSSYGIYAVNNTDIGTAVFDHCTLYGNSYAIYTNNTSASDYTVKNSILTGNTSYGAYENGSNVVRLQYTDHWDNGSGNQNVTVTNSINANPLYVSAGTDFELTSNSPARYQADDGSDLGPDWLAYSNVATPGLYGTLWDDTTVNGGVTTVPGDLTVAPGVKLTINFGSTLQFQANSDIMGAYADPTKGELRVQGTLWVLGAAGLPVTIESTGSATDSWYGIHYMPTATGGLFQYAEISEAIYGIRYEATDVNPISEAFIHRTDSAAILVQRGANTFDNITATDGYRGIHLDQGGGGTFTDCLIHANSSYGIYATNNSDIGTALFDHCTLYGNSYAIYTNNSSASDYTIKNSILTGNTSYGAYENGSNVVRLQYSDHWDNGSGDRNVTITNSFSANPIYVSAGTDFELTSNSPARNSADDGSDLGPAWLAYTSAATPGWYGTLWDDATMTAGTHSIPGDLTVAPGRTLYIDPGATLDFASNSDIMGAYSDPALAELRVQGAIYAQGTATNPIRMQSTSSTSGSWYGVDFQSGASGSTFQHIYIDEAVNGVRYRATADNPLESLVITDSSTAGILIEAGTPTVDAVRISSGYRGIVLTGSGSLVATNCLIFNNSSYGIYALNSSDIGTALIVNCTIDNNSYGIYTNNSSGSDYFIRNSILSNNTSYSAYENGSNVVSVAYSNLWNNASGARNITSTNNLAVNPQYAGASDYHLQATSPCVDAGDVQYAPDHDIDGKPRPVDGDNVGAADYDMGAYEYDTYVPGITVTPFTTQTTTEAETQVTFDVVLDSPPVGDVIIGVTSSDQTEGTVDVSTLTFTASTWDTPQTVTVTGVDDDRDDGDVSYQINLNPGGSPDLTYQAIGTVVHPMINQNDDVAAILAVPSTGLITTEGGGTASFTITLGAEPINAVRLDVTSLDLAEGTTIAPPVPTPVITFDNTDWDQPKTAIVTGVDDGVADGDVAYQISVDPALSNDSQYANLAVVYVDATNRDDETVSPGILVSKAAVSTSEPNGTDTFTIVLESAPTAAVTITLGTDDASEATVSPQAVTFDSNDWDTPQTVTVNGQDDDVQDGQQTYTVTVGPVTSSDTTYSVLDPNDLSGTNDDDDTAGIDLSKATVATTEAGTDDSFTVVLLSEPTDTVTIDIVTSDDTEAQVSPAQLSFDSGNWGTPQTVDVVHQDDAIADGNQSYDLSFAVGSNDGIYAAMTPTAITGTNADDDSAAVLTDISGTLVTTESGPGTATFDVWITSAPSGTVTVDVASTDTDEGTVSPAQLTFNTANASQTVTVTGVDDAIADGTVAYDVTLTISSGDPAYTNLPVQTWPAENTDDDVAGVTVTPTSRLVTTEAAAGTDTFTVVLDTPPTDDVTIPVSTDNAAEGSVSPTSLVFTDTDWDQPQTVTVTGVDDGAVDGDIVYHAVLGAASSNDLFYKDLDPTDVEVTNLDDDGTPPGISFTRSTGFTTESGGTDAITVVLDSLPGDSVTVFLVSDTPSEAVVSPQQLSFTTANWDTPQNATIAGVDDDVDDIDVNWVVTATTVSNDSSYNNLSEDLGGYNVDDDSAGVLIDPTTGLSTSEDGGTDSFDIVLLSQPVNDVVINLDTSNPNEGVPDLTTVTFTASNWDTVQTITITGVDDTIDDGDIAYTIDLDPTISLDANYFQLALGDVEVVNIDDDEPRDTDTDLPIETDTEPTDTEDPVDETPTPEGKGGGCGCDNSGSAGWVWLAGLALLRRRQP